MLPGTKRLTLPRDVYAEQHRQALRFFERLIAGSREARAKAWSRDFTSVAAYQRSVAPSRERMARLIGAAGRRPRSPAARVASVASGDGCEVFEVRFAVFDGLRGRALMLRPKGDGPFPAVVVVHDSRRSPETVCGLTRATRGKSVGERLVAAGCIVLAPHLVTRESDHADARRLHKSLRHILYRLAYPVGRHILGADVATVRAALDVLAARPEVDSQRLGLCGVGLGATVALYASALDERPAATALAGPFTRREQVYKRPADENIWRQLLEFSDADVASLVAPRPLCVTPKGSDAEEMARAEEICRRLGAAGNLAQAEDPVGWLARQLGAKGRKPVRAPQVADAAARSGKARDEQYAQLEAHFRRLIAQAPAARERAWKLDHSSLGAYERSVKAKRAAYRDLIGHFGEPRLPLRPRTLKAAETDRYVGYRVKVDVVEGIEAFGILLIPKGLKGKAPAVFCQHGLSGLPEEICGMVERDTPYHAFGRRLAERGYVVMAPRILTGSPARCTEIARRAYPVGRTRVGLDALKLGALVDFVASLPQVDAAHIGFYGLSYGGYTALWVPPVEPRFAAVVCSGHFNNWQEKLTNKTLPTSYLAHPDEDFYNFDVLNQFNHSDLVSLVAPRPYLVEWGLRDGVAPAPWVNAEWPKVPALYKRLGIPTRTALATFDGPHEVHGVQAFAFLDRWLCKQAKPQVAAP